MTAVESYHVGGLGLAVAATAAGLLIKALLTGRIVDDGELVDRRTRPWAYKLYAMVYALVLVGSVAMIIGALRDTSTETHSQQVMLSTGFIRRVESRVIMPEGSAPLASYTRFYTTGDYQIGNKIHRVVVGMYVARDAYSYEAGAGTPVEGIPGAFIVSEFPPPPFTDGGCKLVHVVFDLETLTPAPFSAGAGVCHGGF